MHNLVFLLLMAMVFQIPWEALVTLGAFGTLIRVIGMGAAFLGFLAVLTSGRMRGLLFIHYLMGLFVAFAAMSIFWTQAINAPYDKILTFIQLFVFSWLIWEFAPDVFRQRLLIHAYVWGAGLAVMIQFLGMRGYIAVLHEESRFAAGGMNVNEFGLLLIISIPMAIYCALDPKTNRLIRIAYILFCPVCAVSVLLTGSRMAFLVGGAMAATIGLIYLFKRPILVITVGIIAGATFFFLFNSIMPESTWARLTTTYDELQSGSWSGRLIIYEAALHTNEQYPMLGTGCGSFATVVAREFSSNLEGQTAHNSYLCILVELGYIGLLLFVSILIAAGLYTFNMPFRERYTWLIIHVSFCVCAFVGTLEAYKVLWFILAMITCQHAIFADNRIVNMRTAPVVVPEQRRQLLMRSRWGNTRGV